MDQAAHPGWGVVRIVLVEAPALTREGLKLLLRNQPGVAVVGEAEDEPSAVAVVEALTPDVTVLGPSVGAPVLVRLRAHFPAAKFVALASHEDPKRLRSGSAATTARYVGLPGRPASSPP